VAGPKPERYFENLLTRFPDLVSRDLCGIIFPVVDKFGETDVCVRQGRLPECSGIIDLAFITLETIHLVELKRAVINEAAVRQLWRYYGPLQKYYPNHEILGYVAGRRISGKQKLNSLCEDHPFRVLLFGVDIPSGNEVRLCPNCKAGVHAFRQKCPYCEVVLAG